MKLSELSTKMRQDAKLRQQGIFTKVYRAQRQVARIILAHECNLTQPSRTALRRNSRSETRPTRGAGSAESAGTSGSIDFTVPLDRQSSRRPDQTYMVDNLEGWSRDSCQLPGRNQENNDVSTAGLHVGGTRPRGLTVRISEQQEREKPVQPEGASTPLEEVRPMMLDSLAAIQSLLGSRPRRGAATETPVTAAEPSRASPAGAPGATVGSSRAEPEP